MFGERNGPLRAFVNLGDQDSVRLAGEPVNLLRGHLV